MKILLFGSTGLLGTHLLREFLRREWDVVAPQRDDINLFNLSQVNNFVGPWLCRNPDGIVVYAAGLTNISTCDKNPGNAEHLNVLAPFLLANLCSRVGARFIYFSTDQVFMSTGMTGFYLHHEDDQLDGSFRTTQVYGRTKADAETFTRRYTNTVVIRTSWLFGDHPTRSNFVRDVVNRARNGEPIVGLHDYVACPSYAVDVARASSTLLACETAAGVYHLVNGPPVSRFTMAQTVLKHAGIIAEVQPVWQTMMGPDWIPRNANGGLNNNRGPQLRPWTNALDEYLTLLLPKPETTPA